MIHHVFVNVATSRITDRYESITTEKGKNIAIITSIALSILIGVSIYFLFSLKMASLSVALFTTVNILVRGPKLLQDDLQKEESPKVAPTKPDKPHGTSPGELNPDSKDLEKVLETMTPESLQIGFQEMMTIVILFHQSNYRTFKHFYAHIEQY